MRTVDTKYVGAYSFGYLRLSRLKAGSAKSRVRPSTSTRQRVLIEVDISGQSTPLSTRVCSLTVHPPTYTEEEKILHVNQEAASLLTEQTSFVVSSQLQPVSSGISNIISPCKGNAGRR